MSAFSASSFWEIAGFRGIPPPPHPSESRDWRGVCKNGLQNLEPLGVRGQNLENTGVRWWFAISVCSASGLAIFCSLNFEVKVGCHIGLWKTKPREIVERENRGTSRLSLRFCPAFTDEGSDAEQVCPASRYGHRDARTLLNLHSRAFL
jgi:hypothetical protein